MKPLGITRSLDKMGRIVIPKEIRKTFKWVDNQELEIIAYKNGSVIIRKPEGK
jgi:AbrB family looped-hinge helix DNA binding protein